MFRVAYYCLQVVQIKPVIWVTTLRKYSPLTSTIIFDIRAVWRSVLSVRVPGCQKLQMTVAVKGLGLCLL